MADPLLRQTLSLRFGADRGWQERTPREVGGMLGGRYRNSERLVAGLIKRAQKAIPLVAEDPSQLQVLYEDEDLLAVSKPPGLRTAPRHRFLGDSLVSQLIGYLRPENGSSPPFIVHRLDRGTSGVLLCAKTSMDLFIYRPIYLYVYLFVYVYIYIYIYMRIYIYIHILYIYIYIYARPATACWPPGRARAVARSASKMRLDIATYKYTRSMYTYITIYTYMI